MGFASTLLNVITFGGYGRVQEANADYNGVYRTYRSLHDDVLKKQKAANSALAELGRSTEELLRLFKKVEIILFFSDDAHTVTEMAPSAVKGDPSPLPGLRGAVSILAKYHAHIAAVEGAGVGGAAALGSWSLVSLLGTASTGTALSGLTGAAATHATLAWFGGGAIAAGGAGMLGGTLALSGIVAIPMIAVATRLSHKKADEIRHEIQKLQGEIATLSTLAVNLTDLIRSTEAQKERLFKAAVDRTSQFAGSKKVLFPLGPISRLRRCLRLWLGGRYYGDGDVPALAQLDAALHKAAQLFGHGPS
jgi:hypothetical protein